jgi:hypothetical protein
VQIVPTFDYLIPYWTPILMNTCKFLEDTLRHWTYHVIQYLHYYTLHTLTTIGPHVTLEDYVLNAWKITAGQRVVRL